MTFTSATAPSKLVVATIFALLVSTMALQSLPAEASVGGNGVCETANFAGGDGTSADPFLIADADDLQELGDCITEQQTSGVHYKQIQDIDVTGSGSWSPLGSDSSRNFAGTYNAASTSRNLVFAYEVDLNSTASLVRGGMFFGLTGGEVVGLGISASMTVEATNVVGTVRVGALAGRVDASLIQDVDATVDLLVSASSLVYLGGIAGEAVSSTMSGVTVMGSLKSFHSRTTPQFNNVGGAVGRAGGKAFFSDIEVMQLDGQSKIYATNLLTSGKPFVGGLIGDTDSTGQLTVSDVRVSIPLIVGSASYPEMGGVIGRTLLATTIERALVTSTMVTNNSGQPNSTGGLVGEIGPMSSVRSVVIHNSEFAGHLINRIGQGGYSSQLGGLVGALGSQANLVVSNSSNVGAVSSPSTSQLIFAAGILGELDGSTAVASISNVLDSPVISSNVLDSFYARPVVGNVRSGAFGGDAGSVVYDSDSYTRGPLTPVGNAGNLVGVERAGLSNSANIPFDSYSNVISDNSVAWNQCAIPFLSWLGSEGCAPRVSGANLRNDGREVEIYFTQALSPQSADLASFHLVTGRGNIGASGAALLTSSGRAIVISLSSTVLVDDEVYLNFASSPSIESTTGVQALTRNLVFMYNTSTVSGPVVDGLATNEVTPSSVQISFVCGGSCDPSASYDYEASITPAGGSATTQTATKSGTATLSFNDLTPNVAHVISVSVTQGGLTSPAATLNVTTPKPIATISALTVADISATLTVGCTNCGAAPDSFVITATPQDGGAAITSTTALVSGLTSETTYSFAVVVRFAGVDSDSVNWQSNPVMTLPFVPIITSVSPEAIGVNGNNNISITGSNFSTSNAVTLDGSAVDFTIVSGTEITISAPAKTAGSYDLAITNLVGTNTLANAITYVSGPRITVTSPIVGTTNGGTIVSITGTDLVKTSEVLIGDATVSFTVESDTLVRFVTPASSSGVVSISVTTPGGSTTSPVAFEYTTSALVPVIGSITPVTGPVAGGTTITVTGQYFSGSYSDSVSAAINGISGSSIVLIDDSTLTFVSPPGAAATGLDVTVATGGGLGTLAGAFTYTAPPAPQTPTTAGSAPPVVINTPTITEFSTREISASGAEVIATGQRLENVSVLTLGGITVTIVSNTATSLTFTTGEMPVGVWDLRLVGSNGTLVFQQAIEVVEATSIVAESTGELLGYTWTFKFLGNSRSLHLAQREHLTGKLDDHATAETIICWGYTTAASPNAWAIAHATQRAQAACDMASANNSELKTVVRLRNGVSKNWAMRSALQFWR